MSGGAAGKMTRFERAAALGGDPRETLTYFAEAERQVRAKIAAAAQPKPAEYQRYLAQAEFWEKRQAVQRAEVQARWASWRAFEG